MKTFKTISILLCLFFFNQITAQHKMTPAEKENAENKVQIYTSTERDNLQMWFHERVVTMELTEEQEEEYYRDVAYYVASISHLNNKDKGLTDEEVLAGMENYVTMLNTEVQPILSKEQYQIHLGSFKTFKKSFTNRLKEK